MKFRDDQKKAIQLYILEKIACGSASISKAVAENFDVNPSTVHAYMNELIESGMIRKLMRGRYELVTNEFAYEMSRSNGELDSDTSSLSFLPVNSRTSGLRRSI